MSLIRITLVLAVSLSAQQPTTIKVPVRLVSVPTLVASKDGKYIPGLPADKFRLTDNGRPRTFTLDTEDVPVSVAVVVQVDQDVREYLPFLAKVGSLVDNSLAAAQGEDALLTYNDEISLAKPFGKGDLQTAMEKLKPAGHEAHMIDAGLRGIELLRERTGRGSRVLLFIGQPKESGSAAKMDALAAEAERENVQIYALTLPLFGKSFVSDSFRLEGLGSQWYKGGYRASVELTKAVPALRRAAEVNAGADPFSFLTVATGGLQIHFRKQKQLEDAIIALGDALRSRYFLSFTPDAADDVFHSIGVQVDVPGATVYARPGYKAAAK
ncbi:MAG TPA: VWA domain-containing protein [Bryobacteraceae bacterium]|nr:VWA domain-containing protein [Bryobacteraceae bacterium]